MKKGQTITLKINSQSVISLMVAMLVAMTATVVLAIVLLSGKAKADNTQTVNANPGFSVPQGYVLVPANNGDACPKPATAAQAQQNTQHVLSAVAAPYYFNNVSNQTINDSSVKDSNILNIDNSNNSGTINNKIEAEVEKKISKKISKHFNLDKLK